MNDKERAEIWSKIGLQCDKVKSQGDCDDEELCGWDQVGSKCSPSVGAFETNLGARRAQLADQRLREGQTLARSAQGLKAILGGMGQQSVDDAALSDSDCDIAQLCIFDRVYLLKGERAPCKQNGEKYVVQKDDDGKRYVRMCVDKVTRCAPPVQSARMRLADAHRAKKIVAIQGQKPCRGKQTSPSCRRRTLANKIKRVDKIVGSSRSPERVMRDVQRISAGRRRRSP